MSGAVPVSLFFEAQYKRVFEAAGCRTQLELAAVLGVKRAAISDVRRRKCIPEEWRRRLFEKKRINPDWILYGEGGKYLAAPGLGQFQVVCVTESRPLGEYSAQELVGELVRRSVIPA